MGDVPYPLTADTVEELKRQIWELVRQLFEDKVGGLEIGDVFSDSGGVLELNILSGLVKTAGYLSVKPDGTSITVSDSGIKVGQSAFIADPAGGTTVDTQARTAIVAILDLLIARGLMASS
jgi:hypothetical protein